MAIGIGITLGIKLPENFNAPYLSQSISDFLEKMAHNTFKLDKKLCLYPYGRI